MWFQNRSVLFADDDSRFSDLAFSRRAKTKAQARKAEQGGQNGKKEDENSASPNDTNGNGSTNTSASSPSSSSSPASSLSIHRTSISSASSVEDEASTSPTDALAAADDAQSVSSGSQTVRGESGPSSVSPPSTSGTDAATSPTAVVNVNDSPDEGPTHSEMDMPIWNQPYPFGEPPAENAVPALDGIPPDAPVDGKNGIGLGEVDEMPSGYLNIPEHLRNQRRTSLPIIVSPPDTTSHHPSSYAPPSLQRSIRGVGGLPPGFDPGHRRRSVDTNMLRLSAHPYAYAMAPPNATAPGMYGAGGRSISSGGQPQAPQQIFRHGSMPHVFGEDQLQQQPHDGFGPNGYLLHPVTRRPLMQQRMSMPAAVLQKYHQQYQMHAQNQNSGSPPSAFNNHYGRYGIPSREVPAPVPGPLPSPGFSFGTSSTSPNMNNSSPNLPAASTSSSPSGPSSTFPLSYPHFRGRRSVPGFEDPDTEDDGSAVSSTYDKASRFGSFASMAGSETSLTSAWCSDTGSGVNGVGGGELKIEEQQQQQLGQQGQSAPEGFDPDLRRASW